MNHLIAFYKVIGLAVFSFLLSRFIAKKIIKFFKSKGGQVERKYLNSHQVKNGTATAGGISFVIATLLSVAIFDYRVFLKPIPQAVVIIFVGYFLIGLIDDIIKLKRKSHLGLPGLIRLFFEFLLPLIALKIAGFDTPSLWYIEFAFAGFTIYLGITYIVLVLILVAGFANAANLTDGLDGLISGLLLMAITPFLFICLKEDYLLGLLITSLIGSLLGFLSFNIHPAKIFMGDCGSLSLGGIIAIIAVVLKKEIILIIASFLLILETISVIIQVVGYKLTKKRVFLMAPLHHHFEKLGWPESKVIMSFWIVGFLLSTIAIILGVI